MSAAQDMRVATYLVATHLVTADGNLDQEELRRLDALRDTLGLGEEADVSAQREGILHDSPEAPTLSDLCERLSGMEFDAGERHRIALDVLQVAFADGYLSHEQEAFAPVAEALRLSGAELDGLMAEASRRDAELRSQAPEQTWLERLNDLAGYAFYLRTPPEERKQREEGNLGGYAMRRRLQLIAAVAESDIERASRTLDLALDTLHTAQRDTAQLIAQLTAESKVRTNKQTDEVRSRVRSQAAQLATVLRETIDQALRQERDTLDKKRRSAGHYTIAFLGRTKAGKSTLHKVVTGDSGGDVGRGLQRTTRYNRSWYWHELRIVDTPGIGAAEEGGRKDEEIALSVVDEAEVICYIVMNDSIQETEFKFLETIILHNKPLFVLLNCKGSFQGPRLRRFLEAPEAWLHLPRTDAQCIEGHIERARELIDKYYPADAVRFIPLQLRAAELAQTPNSDTVQLDTEQREKLLRGSNIAQFNNELRRTLVQRGALQKSQNILDGCALPLRNAAEQLTEQRKLLMDSADKLKEQHTLLSGKLQGHIEQLRSRILENLETAQNALKSRAWHFADEHCENKDAGEAWPRDYEVKRIGEDLQNDNEEASREFGEAVQSDIEDALTDLQITFGSFTAAGIAGEHITDVRMGVRIAGKAGVTLAFALAGGKLGAAIGTAILPGVGSAVGAVIGAVVTGVASLLLNGVVKKIAGLFMSKEEKHRRATEAMAQALSENIDTQIQSAREQMCGDILRKQAQVQETINVLLGDLESNCRDMSVRMERLIDALQSDEGTLNALFAARLVDAVASDAGPEESDQVATLTDEALRERFQAQADRTNHKFTCRATRRIDNAQEAVKFIKEATQFEITFTSDRIVI